MPCSSINFCRQKKQPAKLHTENNSSFTINMFDNCLNCHSLITMLCIQPMLKRIFISSKCHHMHLQATWGNSGSTVQPRVLVDRKYILNNTCHPSLFKITSPALQINIIPLPVTMNTKTKKALVRLNFWWSQ